MTGVMVCEIRDYGRPLWLIVLAIWYLRTKNQPKICLPVPHCVQSLQYQGVQGVGPLPNQKNHLYPSLWVRAVIVQLARTILVIRILPLADTTRCRYAHGVGAAQTA